VAAVDATALARWQFGITTIYHYLFVPASISLATLTALLQTAWRRTGSEVLLRLTKLSGKLLLVTFVVGVVTGLVQEFQFGLAWSDFARFYGDVFGPTLAVEGMLAFFLEATFLGLWFFGWDRLPARVHLACAWVVAAGTLISAFVILGANSFLQNPQGYTLDPETGRARLDSFSALLLNPVNTHSFPHVVAGAYLVGGAMFLAIGLHHTFRGSADAAGARVLLRLGAWVTAASGAALAGTGDLLGKLIAEVQPMKMAAAEGLYATTSGAPFSVFSWFSGGRKVWGLEVPNLLSFLVSDSFTARVQGIDDLQSTYSATYGAGDYVPVVPVAFWSFRAMIGFGMAAAGIAVLVLWLTRGGRTLTRGTRLGRLPVGRLLALGVPVLPLLPLVANSTGWLFTETARQPWLVFGLYKTADGVSPGTTAAEVIVTLVAFTVVYGALAVAYVTLVLRLSRSALDAPEEAPVPEQQPERELATW
jgi:cytochrome d ubiquinol oxidase subunit I